MILQSFEGLSDREARDRLGCDLRWQAAAGVHTGYEPFDPTLLVGMRNRLRASERPRRAIHLLDAGELLDVILPEVSACKGVAQSGYHTHDVYGHTLLALERVPPDLVLRLAALFHDVGKPSTATPDGAFTGHENVGAELARLALERLRLASLTPAPPG